MKGYNSSNIKSYISEYKFEKNAIRLKVKIKIGKPLEYVRGKYAILLRDSENDTEFALEVVSIDLQGGEFGIWVKLNSSEYIEAFGDSAVDFYLIDREIGYECRVNAEDMDNSFEEYYSVRYKQFLKLYKDEEGGLSIGKSSGGNILELEEMDIDERGCLFVRGMLNCAKLDSAKMSNVLSKVRVKDCEGKNLLEINVDGTCKDEVAEQMKYTGIDYSNCVFEFKINLTEIELNKEKVNGNIYLVLGKDKHEVEIPLANPMEKKPIIHIVDANGKVSWLLQVKGKSILAFAIEDVRTDLEVREICVKDTTMNFVLDKKINNIGLLEKEQLGIVLRDRVDQKTYNLKCKITNGEVVEITCDFRRLISKADIGLGAYDMYLKVNGEYRRMVSRQSRVLGEEDLNETPNLYSIEKNKKEFFVRIVYTNSNQISLSIRKIMEVKDVLSVRSNRKGIQIEGLMYIRKPLENENNEFDGVLKFELDYGVGVELNYNARVLSQVDENMLYEFEMVIPKEEIDNSKYNVKYLLKSLSNKIVTCLVSSTPENRSIVFSISAKNIALAFDGKLKKMDNVIDKVSEPMYNLFNKVLPIDNKLMVFQSCDGKSYSCNPKAIYEELISSNSGYKCVWVMEDCHNDLPGVCKVVRPNSLSYYYYISRSKYFVSNTPLPDFYEKRNGSINIYTGQGTPLHKVELDNNEYLSCCEENNSDEQVNEIKKWDYIFVPNDYTKEMLLGSDVYEDRILKVGCPKNDIFYNDTEKRVSEVKKKLSIPDDKKVVMYAPIYNRSANSMSDYKLPFKINEFNKRFGDKYVLLLRLNCFDADKLDNSCYKSNVKNVSLYGDISELYLVTDILITDYSSDIFNYANSKRPMLFYTHGTERYKNKINELNFDFEKLAPGPLIDTEEELFESIEKINEVSKTYDEKYSKFLDEFCYLEDGNSSKRVIEEILKQ